MISFEPISLLQRNWLQEIGVDRSLLMRLPLQDSVASAGVQQPLAVQPVHSGSTSPAPSKETAMQAREKALALIRPRRAQQAAAEPMPSAPVLRKSTLDLRVLAADLSGLQEQITVCDGCELHEGRALTVFGRGAEQQPDWLVVGEAPGSSDDRSGHAFDGQAGELLQSMLNSVLPEASFYFTHLVKCRPLGNRPPKQEELDACRRFLDKQIDILQPKRILAVGQLAARVFAQHEQALETMRGQVLRYEGPDQRTYPLVLSYHPAALLLRPQFKVHAWRDLLMMRELQQKIH